MEFWIMAIIFIVIISIIVAVQLIVTSGRVNEFFELLSSLDEFDTTDTLLSVDGLTGIAHDSQRKKICLIGRNENKLKACIYDYGDVLSCEVFEDGETITKTSRMSQFGGALIGGIAFGGLGAVVGGLSGKNKTTNLINRIDLRMIINDSKNPVHDISLLNSETTKSGIIYKTSIENARRWHGLLTVIIKQADLQDESVNPEDTVHDKSIVETTQLSTPSFNLMEELSKLGDLLDRGILTEEEFQTQKKRLLSN